MLGYIISFIVGCCCGFVLGVLTLALCVVGRSVQTQYVASQQEEP